MGKIAHPLLVEDVGHAHDHHLYLECIRMIKYIHHLLHIHMIHLSHLGDHQVPVLHVQIKSHPHYRYELCHQRETGGIIEETSIEINVVEIVYIFLNTNKHHNPSLHLLLPSPNKIIFDLSFFFLVNFDLILNT